MNKFNALDWQVFSEKKNIEEIARNTKERKWVQIISLLELAAALLSLGLAEISTLTSGSKLSRLSFILWVIITIIAVIIICALFFFFFRTFWIRHTADTDSISLKEAIDLFDNDLCYYVMTADAYCEELRIMSDKEQSDSSSINSDANSIDAETKQFYYIEANFYINKAISCLDRIDKLSEKLYSADRFDLMSGNAISATRLINICNLLDKNVSLLINRKQIIKPIDTELNDNFSDICDGYQIERLNHIKQTITKQFGWVFK